MSPFLNKWSRKLHRHASLLIALPLLVVIGSGILLQLKKEWSWIQPPTQKGVGGPPSITFERVLAVVAAVPEAGVNGWDDIDRLDVRPSKGMLKVRCNSGMEVQIDTETGDVLQVERRRSDLIESLHDGSWFHDSVKLWVFLPSGLILLFLWVSGLYLWFLPFLRANSKPSVKRAATTR